MKYRIVKVNAANPYRVQERPPLWASLFIPMWEFVGPYHWHKTLQEAQADMERRVHQESYLEVVR